MGTGSEPSSAVRQTTVHQSHGGDLAIRQGPWKLVMLKSRKTELYNLKDDLAETRDLAAEQPAVVARLRAAMDALRSQK